MNWDAVGTILVTWQIIGMLLGQLWTSRDDQPWWWMVIGIIVFGPLAWLILLFVGSLCLFGWVEEKLIGPPKDNS